jgi:tripartite-type tricarboxylate transporter receptor subunit TctC
MKVPRRQFLHLAAGSAALPVISRIARAQTYPTKPVRIIVGFPAGGAQDISARSLGQWLSERLGQPFVIENRSGATGNIGAQAAVNASPDGYTLLLVGVPNAINASFYANLTFNFMRDIVPVAGISLTPLVMVVNPSVPAKTVPEFIAYAKANPGKLNMASGGIGNVEHLVGELFKMMTGVSMLHVPYRGTAPALTELLGGQTQVYFAGISPAIEHIRAGKLRALAVTTATRLTALPEVPTLGELLPGYEASGWNGIGAPRGTPDEIVEKLNREINAGLADPAIKARFADLGAPPLPLSPADFGKLIAVETEKWGKVIRAATLVSRSCSLAAMLACIIRSFDRQLHVLVAGVAGPFIHVLKQVPMNGRQVVGALYDRLRGENWGSLPDFAIDLKSALARVGKLVDHQLIRLVSARSGCDISH